MAGTLLRHLTQDLVFLHPLCIFKSWRHSSTWVLPLKDQATAATSADMADSKLPSEPPPDYEQAAAEHSDALAQRNAPPAVRRGPLPLNIPIIKHLNSSRVILASASPRRKALLQQVLPVGSGLGTAFLT